jgi:hypothetical protein
MQMFADAQMNTGYQNAYLQQYFTNLRTSADGKERHGITMRQGMDAI